jgi:hypothetical protein
MSVSIFRISGQSAYIGYIQSHQRMGHLRCYHLTEPIAQLCCTIVVGTENIDECYGKRALRETLRRETCRPWRNYGQLLSSADELTLTLFPIIGGGKHCHLSYLVGRTGWAVVHFACRPDIFRPCRVSPDSQTTLSATRLSRRHSPSRNMDQPIEEQAELQPGIRPYRSHKLPACTACRHRKGRCHVDDPTQACRYCRQRSLACDHGLNAKTTSLRKAQVQKRMSRNHDHTTEGSMSPQADTSSLPQMSFEQMQAPSESSPVMVDPTMADDLNVLERHLASRTPLERSDVRPYVRISNGPDESIVYRTVSRLRKGLQSTESPGVTQREIMENVLGSLTTHVIKL